MGDLLIDVAQATGQARRQIREERRQDELIARQQENEERKIKLQGSIQQALQRDSLDSQEGRQDKQIQAQKDIQKKEHTFQKFLKIKEFTFRGSQNKFERDLKKAMQNISLKDAKDAREFRKTLEKELIGLRNEFQGPQRERDRQFNILVSLINNEAAKARQALEIASREKLTAAEFNSRASQISLNTMLQVAQIQANDISLGAEAKAKTIKEIQDTLGITRQALFNIGGGFKPSSGAVPTQDAPSAAKGVSLINPEDIPPELRGDLSSINGGNPAPSLQSLIPAVTEINTGGTSASAAPLNVGNLFKQTPGLVPLIPTPRPLPMSFPKKGPTLEQLGINLDDIEGLR